MIRMMLFSARKYDRMFFSQQAAVHNIEISYVEPQLSAETAVMADGHQVVCAFVNDVLDEDVLRHLNEMGVGLVALRCAGFNNCDVPVANRLGIQVVRVPDYSPYSVAEHTFALILALNRKLPRAYNRVRENNFELDGLMGFDLFGKTLGLIGLGKIGSKVVDIANGFGMRVLAFDPVLKPGPRDGFEAVELDHLLKESDIVTLHCPLMPATRHLINGRSLEKMKDGAYLINTSRGGLIDTHAIVAALKSRKLGGLGIDVYENEAGLFFEDKSEDILDDDVFTRLVTFPNVIVTGHQGFFTREALNGIAQTTIQSVVDFAKGNPLENAIVIPDSQLPQ